MNRRVSVKEPGLESSRVLIREMLRLVDRYSLNELGSLGKFSSYTI